MENKKITEEKNKEFQGGQNFDDLTTQRKQDASNKRFEEREEKRQQRRDKVKKLKDIASKRKIKRLNELRQKLDEWYKRWRNPTRVINNVYTVRALALFAEQ